MVAVPTHSDLKPKKLNHKTSLLEEGASRWWEVGPPPDPAPCGHKESQHWPHFQYSLIAHSDSLRKSRGSESTSFLYLPQTCASTWIPPPFLLSALRLLECVRMCSVTPVVSNSVSPWTVAH